MSAFATDVWAAFKTRAQQGVSSHPGASTSTIPPPATSIPNATMQIEVEPQVAQLGLNKSVPASSKEAPGTQFWEEAARYAEEFEKSATKTSNTDGPSDQQDNVRTFRPPPSGDDIPCPSFNLYGGLSLTQELEAFKSTTMVNSVGMCCFYLEPFHATSFILVSE